VIASLRQLPAPIATRNAVMDHLAQASARAAGWLAG
jgi:hypothetical protein